MKGARYQRLIAQVPQIAQVVEQHVALHQQRIQMVQEETMRQQVEMQKALQPDKPPAQSKSSG
jgi:hypothetical protein